MSLAHLSEETLQKTLVISRQALLVDGPHPSHLPLVYFSAALRALGFFRDGLTGAALRPRPMLLASAERWAA